MATALGQDVAALTLAEVADALEGARALLATGTPIEETLRVWVHAYREVSAAIAKWVPVADFVSAAVAAALHAQSLHEPIGTILGADLYYLLAGRRTPS